MQRDFSTLSACELFELSAWLDLCASGARHRHLMNCFTLDQAGLSTPARYRLGQPSHKTRHYGRARALSKNCACALQQWKLHTRTMSPSESLHNGSAGAALLVLVLVISEVALL